MSTHETATTTIRIGAIVGTATCRGGGVGDCVRCGNAGDGGDPVDEALNSLVPVGKEIDPVSGYELVAKGLARRHLF